MPSRFIVGIDLGTTNCAVGYLPITKSRSQADAQTNVRVETFSIPQLVAPSQIEKRTTLPSFFYVPSPLEYDEVTWRMPWNTANQVHSIVGEMAKQRGAEVSDRLVASAKSWLSHSGVDRTAQLLPWHGAADIKKLSPVEVSAQFLQHIRNAWNEVHSEDLLEDQEVVITIPASFDEVARELTFAAARRAGLPKISLLEEPQAAFYAWLEQSQQTVQQTSTQLDSNKLILVCDIGGGTSDFTLIQAQPDASYRRVAVGEHLILGGDNLDLALAYHIEKRLGFSLEPRLWNILIRRCQFAKETLLGNNPPETLTLNLPIQRGAKLIGNSTNIELSRQEVETLLVDGFLPFCDWETKPTRSSSGIQEFGLPFAADPAITHHLATFLRAHCQSIQQRPTTILFNGGFFFSNALKKRLLEVIESWFDSSNKIQILENDQLDLSVAIGAAAYGAARLERNNNAQRQSKKLVSSGLARSYYLGVHHEKEDKVVALCLAPFGLEEGEEVHLLERQFHLLLRHPVEFPLFYSTLRREDKAGDVLNEPLDHFISNEELIALPALKTALRGKDAETIGASIPIHLHARFTNIGTLEIWCTEDDGNRQWKLPFDVRANRAHSVTTHSQDSQSTNTVWTKIDEAAVTDMRECITRTFTAHSSQSIQEVESLMKRLEVIAGISRWDWSIPLLRDIWDVLIMLENQRNHGPIFEARWLNLLGFSLRPGYGFVVDDWRVAQTWRLIEKKLVHTRNELCRAEWWILWRRIAGGLTSGQQRTLVSPVLSELKKAGQNAIVSSHWGNHETSEIWRMLGSLEDLDIATKQNLIERLSETKDQANLSDKVTTWAYGRLGARVPLYGSLNNVLPSAVIEPVIRKLLLENSEDHHFAVTQMACRTGDRYRDISESMRLEVVEWLQKTNASRRFVQLVQEGGELEEVEQNTAFGENLPIGLKLA